MMDEKDTPTHRKVGFALEDAIQKLQPTFDAKESMSFDQMRMIAKACALMVNEDKREMSEECLENGLEALENIQKRFPETGNLIAISTQLLMIGLYGLVNEVACDAIKIEQARIRPLSEQKAEKERAMERSRQIASELWSGGGRELRIGEMADRVYRQMSSEVFCDMLPGGAERLKEWIKPVAPEHARRGGRPKKS